MQSLCVLCIYSNVKGSDEKKSLMQWNVFLHIKEPECIEMEKYLNLPSFLRGEVVCPRIMTVEPLLIQVVDGNDGSIGMVADLP